MRDGITLHCQVFLPAGRSRPVPIVMEMTPYGIDISVPSARRFTEAGLGLALIDCRGRGSSDGEFEMFETDINDTADAIDWLANQSWCDGQVAMRGGSYSGINQWIAAKSRHPALKGIAPWGAAYPGIDVPPGGVPFVGHLGWHVLTSGRDTQWQLASDSEFWMERLAEAYRSNRNIADLAEELGVSRLAFYSALRDPFYAMRNMTF
ncbi:CocE/NonD family hydrolase, partial [Aquidulcibacter sp.]|uniref:CocE/NonD family hydrolase n=1 Tax=Aquidulcibacter sp. TaxID=2052990 RepID=UPI0028A71CC3